MRGQEATARLRMCGGVELSSIPMRGQEIIELNPEYADMARHPSP